MKPRLLLAAVLCVAAGAHGDLRVIDDAGREVDVEQPARRIVSLAPHLTEILFDLGVGDRIVSTVRYSDYPEAAKSIPRLGDAFSVSVESVIAVNPDIVFAWQTGGSNRSVQRLIELGVPVFINEAPTLADIPGSVASMSVLVGQAERGRALATSFRERISLLQSSEADVSVFFQISDERLYTVNADHLIGQAIEVCGGRNVFSETNIPVPLVSQEAVVAANPDLIVITRIPGSPPSAWEQKWRRFPSLRSDIASIDPNLISRPGLRMADGIEALCGLIESNRNKDANSGSSLR